MKKSITFLVLIVGVLFLSGCTELEDSPFNGLFKQKSSIFEEDVYVYNPENLDLMTSIGAVTIVSAEGPEGEDCTISLSSLKDMIEDDIAKGDLPVQRTAKKHYLLEKTGEGSYGKTYCKGECGYSDECCSVIIEIE